MSFLGQVPKHGRTVASWLTGRVAFLAAGVVAGTIGASWPPGLALTDWRQVLQELPSVVSKAASNAVEDLLEPLVQLGHSLRQDGATVPAQPSVQSSRPMTVEQQVALMRPGQDFSACASQFPASIALQTAAFSPLWKPQALCFDGFAVLYSGLTRTPLVTVERLEAGSLRDASELQRTDEFFADARLSSSSRAELADYSGSGYDRGHMAAAANRASTASMVQSFALSNMVPQNSENNRKVWAELEADVRKFARRAGGSVYVFTGPLFDAGQKTVASGRVWVPSHLFKLVYDQSSQRAWAYVLPNTAQARLFAPMDYAQFVQRTGWNFLAAVPVQGTVQH